MMNCPNCKSVFFEKGAVVMWDECTDNLLILCPVCKKTIKIYDEELSPMVE